MGITMNLYYTGKDGEARKFAEKLEQSGTTVQRKEMKKNRRTES